MATKVSGMLSELPWLRPLLRALPIKRVQDLLGADDRVQSYGQIAVANARNSDNMSKANVFSKILAESEKEKNPDSKYLHFNVPSVN